MSAARLASPSQSDPDFGLPLARVIVTFESLDPTSSVSSTPSASMPTPVRAKCQVPEGDGWCPPR
jgi:hypothetical protein